MARERVSLPSSGCLISRDNEAFSVPGFQAIALDAPLGVALLSANVGDIVSYDLLDSSVRVEVLGLFDNTHSLS